MKALAFGLAALCAGTASAQSPDWHIGPFARPATASLILSPRPASTFLDPILNKPVHWEALHTFNPAAIVRNGKVFVLYRAEDDSGSATIGGHTSRLGLAVSTDGLTFTPQPTPVFYPAHDAQQSREWPGGVEDPRLVEAPDGANASTYVLTYTQWNRQTYSIGIATSPDLTHWTKHGPAFGDTGKYAHLQYKSAGILTCLRREPGSKQDHLVAAMLRGKYWMYWGEGTIHLATSPDLIHWTPVEDATGTPIAILSPRPNRFDSSFPEVGPPPVLTTQGVVVLYNGKNSATSGDPALGPNAYAAGEALFDPEDPTHLLARDDNPTLQPTMPYEKTGQYAAGTTFAEGLVLFHNRWFLYYGCADSFVAVATAPRALLSTPVRD